MISTRPSPLSLLLILSLLLASFIEAQAKQAVQLGIDVLESRNFEPLQNKRIGLLTHPAGVNRLGKRTIEILYEHPKVNLVALYGPEHGIDGKAKAEIYVPNKTDSKTGLPVYSLYGPTRKPTPEMLKGIDILVIDLQDVGTRSYTYVSAMRLAMEAAFEQGKTVMVLDRPNPLGGLKVSGPPLDKHLMSYVGAYQAPYVHGLTIGELAIMAKKSPGWLNISEKNRKNGNLIVIPMQGWKRNMLWPETGLKWVPTSPAIPDLSAVLGYPMTGLGTQIGKFQHGYGGPYPFRLLNYPGKTPQQLAGVLDSHNIEGLHFKPINGVSKDGKHYSGVYIILKDWHKLSPTELSFHMMRLSAQWDKQGNPFSNANKKQKRLYKIHVGSEEWWNEITSKGEHARVEFFIDEWDKEAKIFHKQSKQHWLY